MKPARSNRTAARSKHEACRRRRSRSSSTASTSGSSPPLRRPANGTAFELSTTEPITPHYGVELLVESVALLTRDLPNVSLEIYGAGDALPAMRSRVEALDLCDRVYVSGRFLPHRDVLERIGLHPLA